jgi:hypothetical protein
MMVFFVASALAAGDSTFRVAFSEPPLFQSPLQPGDASNLMRWRLTEVITGREITLLSVAAVPGNPTQLEFAIYGRWESEALTYRVEAVGAIVSTVLDPLQAPDSADFFGMPAAQEEAIQARELVDIRNPQTEEDIANGALIIGSGGDYQLEGGNSLLKKLIIRRILTAQGEFFHLADIDYGLGVQAKARFTPQQLIKLRVEIERQVQREPEVAAVKSAVRITSEGALIISVLARTQNGENVGLDLPFGGAGTVAL